MGVYLDSGCAQTTNRPTTTNTPSATNPPDAGTTAPDAGTATDTGSDSQTTVAPCSGDRVQVKHSISGEAFASVCVYPGTGMSCIDQLVSSSQIVIVCLFQI